MPEASELRNRVAFDKRPKADDGAGNKRGAWQEQFKQLAGYVYAGGGEAVMAARLEGRGVVKVRLRSSSQTRSIRSDWRMRDVRTGAEYNVKQVDFETDRRWVYLVVERGSAP
ncbi:phage head completion protein [Oryzicola mucosus]|uniref:Head-tail adaptor protein n=1 Tax=Oryzicola mucosus TaxID=2767425 RepID=A0A8J6PL71_9HYPH|nr:head-tail adaptor protein [Oryzicola mucosus]MBD0416508.1 head-tail adaptor protein [Oryzicola mucosus]